MSTKNEFPCGVKVGDFIQTCDHFGDIYFEVINCYVSEDGRFWNITYVNYDKYSSTYKNQSVNAATPIRSVIPAENAIPYMLFKHLRFKSLLGQYDPFIGFAPLGTHSIKNDVIIESYKQELI